MITATYVEVPLTQGFVAVVDATDEELVASFKWYAGRSRLTAYAQTHLSEITGRPIRRMHSLLTGWIYVDHINGNGLDNRRANLRQATHQQNGQNQRKTRGSSQFKGVRRDRRCDRWEANISMAGRQTYLGLFVREVDAAHAYDEAARRFFGEFAALNFARPGERSARSS